MTKGRILQGNFVIILQGGSIDRHMGVKFTKVKLFQVFDLDFLSLTLLEEKIWLENLGLIWKILNQDFFYFKM